MDDEDETVGRKRRREPIFDIGPGVGVPIAVMIAVAIGRAFTSTPTEIRLLLHFAFIPERYLLEGGVPVYPGGWGAMAWTFLSHAFLHGGLAHLLFNTAMLAAIGKPVVARIGTGRFLGLLAAAIAAGAAVHLAIAWGSPAPMIGASGGVSGLLGAFARFFSRPPWVGTAPLGTALADPRVRGLIFAFAVMNLILAVFGSGILTGGGGGEVAWGAHLGGFALGFLGFRLFEGRRGPA